MVYSASVVRVMIASPSDVQDARDAVEQALYAWNDAHGEERAVSLQPWRWETNAVPILGGEPQALINSQLLDRADIVIALVGSRLGSPTAAAASGTVEEIERALAADKPVHLYFSLAPLPIDVDTRQLDGVREFKKAIQERGLYGEYRNTGELFAEVWKVIAHDLASLNLSAPPPSTTAAAADPVSFRVQRRSNGRDHFVDITNRSATTDAENVVIAQEGEWSGHVLPTWNGPTVIHAEQTRSVAAIFTMGRNHSEPAIRVSWDSEGESHSKVFVIS